MTVSGWKLDEPNDHSKSNLNTEQLASYLVPSPKLVVQEVKKDKIKKKPKRNKEKVFQNRSMLPQKQIDVVRMAVDIQKEDVSKKYIKRKEHHIFHRQSQDTTQKIETLASQDIVVKGEIKKKFYLRDFERNFARMKEDLHRQRSTNKNESNPDLLSIPQNSSAKFTQFDTLNRSRYENKYFRVENKERRDTRNNYTSLIMPCDKYLFSMQNQRLEDQKEKLQKVNQRLQQAQKSSKREITETRKDNSLKEMIGLKNAFMPARPLKNHSQRSSKVKLPLIKALLRS